MKRYKIVLHEKAEVELDRLYEEITLQAGVAIAGNYLAGIYDFIDRLSTFPERGTVREGKIPDLRIIGYRRSASIAFFVKDDKITILGVFQRGQNITPQILEKRL